MVRRTHKGALRLLGEKREEGAVGKSLYCGFCEKELMKQGSEFRIGWIE